MQIMMIQLGDIYQVGTIAKISKMMFCWWKYNLIIKVRAIQESRSKVTRDPYFNGKVNILEGKFPEEFQKDSSLEESLKDLLPILHWIQRFLVRHR